MIPHATLALAGSVSALLVTMIGASLVAVSMFLARLAGCLAPASVAARLPAVHVAVVAPAVYPELAAAMLAMS